MILRCSFRVIALLLLASTPATVRADEAPTTAPAERTADVIYGRAYGTALTLDVFRPTAEANGAAVIFVVSGGWFSNTDLLNTPFFAGFIQPFTGRGYTVFAVVHGSQPKFQIPEIIEQLNRSVRFIRHNAAEYGIDPDRIGITGGSAGGHLSLMQGLAPQPAKADAKDPVDQQPSRVQAVACFYPPTDFFNYGKEGENALGKGVLAPFRGAFDFREPDGKTSALIPITDEERINAIGREISPANHVSEDDPPTLIIHGDADVLVPIQQAQLLIDKLKQAGVTAELVTKAGGGHGWPDMMVDMERMADWFDAHLKPASK